ncbi:Bcr/CflA family efflux MFS transporter [Rickettsia endosymbiont of Halotydeus destructor]|uniref:Bcr/CflA family efflux MFS transporter n=1 Tax=Rickettsia endosymbiont of Halotydeus destructor TaxID=2996754 RepID=UPI003BB14756
MKIIAKIPPWMLLYLFVLSPTSETMYTAGLPSLSAFFNISGSTAQITSTLYFLGFAFGILSLGRLSDIYGRRPIVLLGLLIYIISSITSTLAVNIEMLMIARFAQAFGASVGSVIGQAMARDSYQGSELSYIYASLSVWLAFIPSLGSSVGGYIVEYSDWRYVFIFSSSMVTILLILYCKILPETNPYMDISQTSKYFKVFKIVVKDKILWLYAFIIGAFNGMTYGFFIEAPFIFIENMGLSPSFYGKLAFLLCLANIFGGLLGGYLIKKRQVDDKKIMILGLGFSLFGCTMLITAAFLLSNNQINNNFAIAIIFIPIMLHMIGHNLLIPMTLRYALEDYAKVTGTAGSIFGSLYYILVALITFIVSKLHSETINNFALLFLCLSIGCTLSFYLIRVLDNNKKKI